MESSDSAWSVTAINSSQYPRFAITLCYRAEELSLFDEATADRVRQVLAARGAIPRGTRINEKKMFGGLVFLLNGNMCCGVNRTGALLVRVGSEARNAALAEPYTRPMMMRDKEVSGFLFVDAAGHDDDASLEKWVRRGIAFASTLKPK